MFNPGQHSKLSPVVAAAWGCHCSRSGHDPHKKKANGYRAWYESILKDATGHTSTSKLGGASDFGKVLLAFAEVAGDLAMVRDLAEDEEHRHRWVLRMLCCDLSYLRGQEVTWDYVRSIYGQSKLPPGEFEDCPADLLIRVIAMLDTQIRREGKNLELRPIQIPRRAIAAARSAATAGKSTEIMYGMQIGITQVASSLSLHPNGLHFWYTALLANAEFELQERRRSAATVPAPTPNLQLELHESTTYNNESGDVPF